MRSMILRTSAFLLLLHSYAAGQTILDKMDQKASHYGQISRQIWESPELGYKEVKSSNLLKAELLRNGFRIEENIGGITECKNSGRH